MKKSILSASLFILLHLLVVNVQAQEIQTRNLPDYNISFNLPATHGNSESQYNFDKSTLHSYDDNTTFLVTRIDYEIKPKLKSMALIAAKRDGFTVLSQGAYTVNDYEAYWVRCSKDGVKGGLQ